MKGTLAIALLLATPAWGHDFYTKTGCCGGDDCRPYPCENLADDGKGGIIDVTTGTRYDRSKVKSSPTAECHICTSTGQPAGFPYCAFTVNGS